MESVAEAMSNDLEGDFQNAKAFLLKTSLHSNLNMWVLVCVLS